MKILMVSLDNSKEVLLGGKHIHQKLIEKGFIELGHSVDTIYPSNKRIINAKRILIKILAQFTAFFQILSFKDKMQTYVAYIVNSLGQKFKKNKYDFILAEDTVSAFAVKKYFMKNGDKIPVLLTLHGYFPRETVNYGYYNDINRKRVFDYCFSIENEAVRFADAIVTVDTRIKNYLHDEHDRSENVYVVFNAIDDKRFFPVSDEEKKKLRKELNLESDKTNLLVARRFVLKNGMQYGIEAARILVSMGYDKFQLVIAGDGPEKNNLTELVSKYKLDLYVKFTGSVDHSMVDKYYKTSDILLMPSTKSDDVEEATSLSMLEGMICGKVVIASAIGGMKEVIRDGENGMLVDDKSPDQIAQKIINLMNDNNLYKKISSRAYEYTRENHAYKNHAWKFLDIYGKLK